MPCQPAIDEAAQNPPQMGSGRPISHRDLLIVPGSRSITSRPLFSGLMRKSLFTLSDTESVALRMAAVLASGVQESPEALRDLCIEIEGDEDTEEWEKVQGIGQSVGPVGWDCICAYRRN